MQIKGKKDWIPARLGASSTFAGRTKNEYMLKSAAVTDSPRRTEVCHPGVTRLTYVFKAILTSFLCGNKSEIYMPLNDRNLLQ
jgi:hypothetical protein